MNNEEKKFSNTTFGFMIGVALFYDALQILLNFVLMGWIVTPIFYLTFWLWFKIKGFSFFSMKRAPTFIVGSIVELIPLIGDLPVMTFTVVRIGLDIKSKQLLSKI